MPPSNIEGECLRYPRASSLSSQPLEKEQYPQLANPHNPATSPIPGTFKLKEQLRS